MSNPGRYLGTAGALAAFAALTLTLAACGGGDDGDSGDGDGGGGGKVTREQWESVELDATKDEILDEFGEPLSEAEYEGLSYTASYAGDPQYGGDGDAGVDFTFNPESGEFNTKSWTETFDSSATIDAGLFAKVSNGMTQDQVESALGQPGVVQDGVTTLSFGVSGQEVEPGTREHCLFYPWRNSDFAGSVCFDESGKAISKDHSTANPATVPPPS
jgi:outer membrane protein assembly factor BamE (lipoprotein component of BamABCDE complex)